ncbi:MAG: sigma-70 family RNA polymerase sigma factor [Lentisphaerae bacterium]|nr:MAG: sigma-70 family RNA polymerase sigma factor [Lentisphaerota bacterium]
MDAEDPSVHFALFTQAMIEQNRQWLLPYARSLTGDPHLAEDVVQETFRRALTHIKQYDGCSPVGAWLRGIARNVALEMNRKRRGFSLCLNARLTERLNELAGAYEESVLNPDEWTLRRQAMRQCFARLNERMRKLLTLRYTHRMRSKQIAEHLAMTVGAVDMAMSRTRRWLYRCINGKLNQKESEQV